MIDTIQDLYLTLVKDIGELDFKLAKNKQLLRYETTLKG